MNKARICYPFTGDTIGGSHISAALLIENLRGSRFEPVVVLHQEGALGQYLQARSISYEIVPLPSAFFGKRRWSRLAGLVSSLSRLNRFIRDHDISLVHTQDARMHFAWALPTRLSKARMVWHQRSKLRMSAFGRVPLAMADRVICNSRFVEESIRRFSSAGCTVVPNPIEVGWADLDRQKAKDALVDELGLPSDTVILGYFANYEDQKRPLIFVKTVANLVAAVGVPIAGLMFGVARGSYKARIHQTACEYRISEHIHHMGFRSPVEPYLAGCDVVIVPAVEDAFGRTIVEAMLVGTPVVAALSGGHKEIIADGETGLLAQPDNHESFATSILELISKNALRDEIIRRAKASAVASFSIARHVATISGIYESVLFDIAEH